MMKNKIMSSLILAAGFLFLSLAGCKKQEAAKTPQEAIVKKPAAIVPVHCDPYREVTGYTALCNELDYVGNNCKRRNCTNFITSTATNYYLQQPGGGDYSVISNETITIAKQNEMIAAAEAWAATHAPAGYIVYDVNYEPSPYAQSGGGSITYANIYLQVTYRKCL